MIDTLSLTPQMMMVLGILGLAVFLFVSEVVRIDIAAVSIMMLLGVLASLLGCQEPDLMKGKVGEVSTV